MTFLADAPPRLTEKQWLGQIVRLAELLGYRVYHTFHSKHSAAGFPDLVMVRRPRLIFAEAKAERGTLTDEQTAWLLALRECGQEAYVWRPSDVEKIGRILRADRDRA